MTVKQLKELLIGVSDETKVYIIESPPLGGFAFLPACEEDSGITEFGAPDEESGEFGEGQGKGFVIAPHGLIATDEDDEETEDKTILN